MTTQPQPTADYEAKAHTALANLREYGPQQFRARGAHALAKQRERERPGDRRPNGTPITHLPFGARGGVAGSERRGAGQEEGLVPAGEQVPGRAPHGEAD